MSRRSKRHLTDREMMRRGGMTGRGSERKGYLPAPHSADSSASAAWRSAEVHELSRHERADCWNWVLLQRQLTSRLL